MRVARYFSNDDIRTDEIPKPIIGPGEFLVKIKKSGICGSDILEYYRKAKMKKLGYLSERWRRSFVSLKINELPLASIGKIFYC